MLIKNFNNSFGFKVEELSRFKTGNFREIERQLDRLGFSNRLVAAIEFYIKYPQPNFQLVQRERSKNEKISFRLFYKQTKNTNNFRLSKCEATLRIAPPIPCIKVEGIDTKKLDTQMQSIDWSTDHHSESLINESVKTKQGLQQLKKIDKIIKSIDKLYINGTVGKDAAEKLMYKHWLGEPWEPTTISLEDLKRNYEWKSVVDIQQNSVKTKSEIYSELKTKAFKDLQQLSNNNLITSKFYFMNDKNYEYLTNQLKSAGFGDTLNDDLRKNIEKQNAEFSLNMQKEYGADKVSAALHFRKSAESDMFFFNKYDLELKKENQQDAMKQTFYPDKGITLKEGYNMLDGRAVHKTLNTKEHEKYTAWLQLDFKNTTESGNYKISQYHQNYGFDLDKTLSKYPIKELGNEKYKADLIRSMERGNLQSATFLVDGKEQKIYIAANPALKSITAFDEKNQKLSLSDLLEKNKQQQSNKQENKQEVSEKPEQKKTNKIKDEASNAAPKNKRRQKIA